MGYTNTCTMQYESLRSSHIRWYMNLYIEYSYCKAPKVQVESYVYYSTRRWVDKACKMPIYTNGKDSEKLKYQ